MTQPDKTSTDQWETIFILFVILVVAVIAYGPLMGGVWEMSAQTTQAFNALVLLGVAFVDALMTALKQGPFRLMINAHGLILFGLSCVALVIASLAQVWPFSILGLCLNVGALLSFCFGRRGVKAFYPALAGFGVLVLMLILVPQVDELLRLMAGRVCAWLLPLLGIRVELLVQHAPFQVFLVAERGVGVFNVATECNGVGVLLSSVVLSLILSLKRRVSWVGLLFLIVGSMGIGFGFNVIRIVAIALAALRTDLPYGFIHEGLGTVIYFLALLAVWLLNSWKIGQANSSR
jgi:exosortase/archaeosortase family protein